MARFHGLFSSFGKKSEDLAGLFVAGCNENPFFPQDGADAGKAAVVRAGKGVQMDAARERGERRSLLLGEPAQEFVRVVAGKNVQLAAELAVESVLHHHIQQGPAVVNDGIELFSKAVASMAARNREGFPASPRCV